MESSSHLPQLSNSQLDLSKIQDAQLIKTKPNGGKGYTAGNSCKTEGVIDNKPTKLLLDPGAFCSCVDKEPLGAIVGHEVDITLNIERPYPQLLRRPAYPTSPKSREALEMHITELLNLGVIRKLWNNEEVEITTPVIVGRHNGKSRMVGDFRGLNTYTVPDRYPIPKIQISLTQISQ
ncbi:hypothetical protein O181_081483 [Austropuccinia psidii MF-1]|uniref:Reverse transcriptase domain-containing protein n=1 Tax=Austropuccinia psidii MF-1 TaxID=1389203 RepID=A0A9Q3FPX9_9BASI|nr:hypothetical protein [Austropuccinia psidii MF-1]